MLCCVQASDSEISRDPRVLVLAAGLGGDGGIERVTRALVRAASDVYGAASISIVPLWGGSRDGPDLPARILRRPRSAFGTALEAWSNKIAFSIISIRAAWYLRGRGLAIIACHPWLAPVARVAAIVGRGRYAVWAHGMEVWFGLRPAQRWGLRGAATLFAPSRFTARRLEEALGMASGTVLVIDHPVTEREESVAPLADDDHPSSAPLLLTVARLDAGERRKGVDTTILAMQRVRSVVPGVRYVIAGDGDDIPRLQALAGAAGVQDSVSFLGSRPDDEVRTLFERCDVFVMPSGQEGLGLAYLEAAYHGRPSIAGDVGGAPEAVIDGETGYVVPYGSVDDLADRLVELLTDGDLRHRMGRAAYARVLERNAFSAFREHVRSIVETLID